MIASVISVRRLLAVFAIVSTIASAHGYKSPDPANLPWVDLLGHWDTAYQPCTEG